MLSFFGNYHMKTLTLDSQLDPAIFSHNELHDLWQDWTDEIGYVALDKWLKRRFRPHNAPKIKRSASEMDHQRNLSYAMVLGVRLQQCVSALERAYEDYALTGALVEIDWTKWDRAFQPDRDAVEDPRRFWAWIHWRIFDELPLIGIRDIEKRQEFVAAFSQAPMSPALLDILQGWRPEWNEALAARATTSGWSASDIESFKTMQLTQPPLWLRHKASVTPTDIAMSLIDQRIEANVSKEGFLYLTGGAGVQSSHEYNAGLIEVQDWASQQIALAVDVKPGQKVWDACAGAGGKTLAIGARMANRGALVATDLHAYKLEELKKRAKRSEIFNVRSFVWEGNAPLRLPKEIAQQKGFDWVLVDAPCSAAGTWRRNPDARWRMNGADTRELIELQRQILTHVIPGIRAGGHLVYATCSWQVAENEAQVEWLLAHEPRLSLVKQTLMGAPHVDSDTMFVAVLQLAE